VLPEIHLGSLGTVPTYLLFLSFLYTGLVFYTFSRSHHLHKDSKTALELTLILMAGGFLGGRLFHVFYEAPDFYLQHPKQILFFWNGGFVFFGGFIGALLGVTVYTKAKNLSFLEWGDFFAPIIALGYGLGRISCFLAGCCYGKFCSLPWAVSFGWDSQRLPRHPTQLYAVFWELMVYVLLIFIESRDQSRDKNLSPGKIFFLWLLFHSVGRLLMEHFRDDFRGVFLAGLSISSWGSLLLFSVAVLFLSYRHFSSRRRLSRV
jgi:phosphatidylglycerol:prolipoprotein diacylglycerol transferase